MTEERLYTEAFIRKSLVSDDWETDESGNPVVIIEASNDNLDYDEERVLQEALMNSKDYFLQNGVISYDHLHLPSPENKKIDPDWNQEKYILGHPLDAWQEENGTIKVKAVLYPKVDLAGEIIKKLQSGAKTVRASVGGRRPIKEDRLDMKTLKQIPTIVSVLWDEVALTYKPVNQTLGHAVLSPKEFVKSLTAGSTANPSEMTGGNALQFESLEKKPKNASPYSVIRSFIETEDGLRLMKMYDEGYVEKGTVIDRMQGFGFPDRESAEKMFNLIETKRIKKGGIAMTEQEKDYDEIFDDLKKSLGGESDEERVEKAKRVKKADDEDMNEDLPLDDEEEEEDEEEMGKGVKKSLEDDLFEDETLVDVSDEISFLTKSMNILMEEMKGLRKENRELRKSIASTDTLLKSIGKATIATGSMLKSIGKQPVGRKTGAVNPEPRWEKSISDRIQQIPNSQKLEIIRDANPTLAYDAGYKLRKGLPLTDECMNILVKSLGSK